MDNGPRYNGYNGIGTPPNEGATADPYFLALADKAPRGGQDGWARVGLERVRNGPSVGGSFAARCSSERGEREKRFYGGGRASGEEQRSDERRKTT